MRETIKSLQERNSDLLGVISSFEKIIESFGDSWSRPNGNYPFIPFAASVFLNQIHLIKKAIGDKKYPFYDFGSGPGTKLVLAKALGGDIFPFCVGYEIDPHLVRVAQKSFSFSCTVIEKNLLELTRGDVPTTPIVAYYYCPIADVERQQRFEKSLEDLLPVGSYLIANMKQGPSIQYDKRFKKLSSHYHTPFSGIYKKIKDNPV